jgi:hypothetical protein
MMAMRRTTTVFPPNMSAIDKLGTIGADIARVKFRERGEETQ